MSKPARYSALAVAVLASACASPTSPSAVRTSTGCPSGFEFLCATPGPTAATLVISSFSGTLEEELPSGVNRYFPELVLTETAGASGASLVAITFTYPDQRSVVIAGGCLLGAIPAGGSRTIGIDTGYSYCFEGAFDVTDHAGQKFSVEVRFKDDAGRLGAVTSAVTLY
jgi:hypothetical protein